MAKQDTFQCSVVTPERKVLECDATFVAFPAHDGEMGVLVDRAPLVCKLGIGPLRVEAVDEKHSFFVDGGFTQVVANRLTILTQQAKQVDELDAAEAREALTQARAMPMITDEAFDERQRAVKRAEVQISLTMR